MGHEINSGDDDGNPTQFDASWGWSRKSREGQPEVDEEIVLAVAGNTAVGECRVDEWERRGTNTVGKLEGAGTVATKGVDVTAATLWPLPLLLLSLGEVGVLEIVGTADTTATTLVCPVTIWPVAVGEDSV